MRKVSPTYPSRVGQDGEFPPEKIGQVGHMFGIKAYPPLAHMGISHILLKLADGYHSKSSSKGPRAGHFGRFHHPAMVVSSSENGGTRSSLDAFSKGKSQPKIRMMTGGTPMTQETTKWVSLES